MATSSAIIIEETEGPRRSLELRGSGLPHQATSWKSELKTSIEWYPGATEATQQVLGPREVPSEWTGKWHLTMLLRTPCRWLGDSGTVSLVQPFDLRDACESMFREGRRLRVSWVATDTSGKEQSLVREGRCTEFEFVYDRLEDVEWKFKFEWLSRGKEEQKAVALTEDALVSAYQRMNATVEALTSFQTNNKVQQSKSSVKRSASRLTLGQLERIATAPQAFVDSLNRQLTVAVNDINRLVGVGDKFRRMPYNVANSCVNTARNMAYITRNTMDVLSRRPPEANVLSQNTADLTRTATYFGQTYEQQRLVAREAAALARTQQSQTNTVGAHGEQILSQNAAGTSVRAVLAVHVVRSGDTPFTLSSRYYGNFDNALAILKANRLSVTSLVLPVGRPLIVPALSLASVDNG